MTLQMRLYTRFNNIKESLHEIYRCVTDSSGQFPLNIVNEIKGTETDKDSTSKSCVIPLNCFV